MQKSNLNFSIVVPVYNSSSTINELIEKLRIFFNEKNYTFQIILVDDYSKDDSWQKITAIKEKYPTEIVAIKLSKNYGQHNAVFCGISHSSGDYVITIDDDLQIMPSEIEKIIEKQKENNSDVVYGIYKDKKHSTFRNWGSKFIQLFSKILLKYPGKGSSFRLFSRSIADSLKNHHHPFIYIDEIIHWYTQNIDFVEVKHNKREFSKSGYSNLKLIKLFFRIVFNYTAFPLKLMTIIGFIFSIVTLILGLRYIFQKIFYNVPLGYTSTIVVILFSTSIIMMCLGIIGEYLSRVYMLQNKKPPYSTSIILK